jgi:hypothetical protein
MIRTVLDALLAAVAALVGGAYVALLVEAML